MLSAKFTNSFLRTIFVMFMISIPLNGIVDYLPLGELHNEIYALFSLLLITITLPYIIRLKTSLCFFFVLFMLSIFWFEGYGLFFKGSFGYQKLINQTILFALLALTSLSIYKIYANQPEKLVLDFSKGLKISLIVTSFACFLELPYVLTGSGKYIQEIFDFIRTDGFKDFYPQRLRGLTFEPPSLAMYMISTLTVLIFNKVFDKRLPYILLLFTLVLASDSRSALFGVILSIFFTYICFDRKLNYNLVAFLLTVTVIFCHAVPVYYVDYMISEENNYHLISNVSRVSSHVANFNLWLDYPIFGVGFGMHAFYSESYFPEWSSISYEVKNWFDYNYNTYPQIYSLYLRLLAETGLLGLLVFLVSCFKMLNIFSKISRYEDNEIYVFLSKLGGSLLISSLVCFIFYGSFNLPQFWVSLAIFLVCLYSVRFRPRRYLGAVKIKL